MQKDCIRECKQLVNISSDFERSNCCYFDGFNLFLRNASIFEQRFFVNSFDMFIRICDFPRFQRVDLADQSALLPF